jgi:hypothetical protein
MSGIRKADPACRRRIALILLIALSVGALGIVGFEHYQSRLHDWIVSDPEALPQRVKTVLVVFSVFLLAPLLALGVFFWSLGRRVLRAREFPPPGLRVIRDTAVVTGERAKFRGRLLKMLALASGISSIVLGLLLWRLAALLSGHAH